jgi:hypothetical protein
MGGGGLFHLLIAHLHGLIGYPVYLPRLIPQAHDLCLIPQRTDYYASALFQIIARCIFVII